MSVPNYTELKNIVLDMIQANVTTDAPFADSEVLREINAQYQILWEESGGGIKNVAGGTAWNSMPAADTSGVFVGKLSDINEVIQIWASLSSGSTGAVGEFALRRVESNELIWRRSVSGLGAPSTPEIYSLTRLASATDGNVNLYQLDVWPGVVGYYYPIQYVPQFLPLDEVTNNVPDVNDAEARDIAYLAAMAMAPRVGRAEFVLGISQKVSNSTKAIMARRAGADSGGKQAEMVGG